MKYAIKAKDAIRTALESSNAVSVKKIINTNNININELTESVISVLRLIQALHIDLQPDKSRI